MGSFRNPRQSVVNLYFGARIPEWALHTDLVIDISLIAAVCVVIPSVDVEFGFLFLWIVFFAALYLSLRSFLFYWLYVSVAYAVVVFRATAPAEATRMWIPLVGTGLVLGFVTVGLVSMLRQSSDLDPLTKLPNRRAWDRRTEEEFERAKRNTTILSMVVIDIDDFKMVNDRDGHQAGDELLCLLADAWRQRVRGGGDFVARLGGDEFGFLAPETDAQEIVQVMQRLETLMPEGVSCSFGASSWDGMGTLADLFRDADEAMYRAKRQRKLAR
ncbi:MAG: GGDEF domain-containing protein [Acidobacteria bacterium]|nr:GGDEF domain-containing protein [Acidobacteriota bacterium]